MTDEPLFLYCPTCARTTLAEIPPCPDGHGDDCPDRACVECGAGLVLEGLLQHILPAPSARSSLSPKRGRAA